MEGLKLITTKEMEMLHQIIWQYYKQKEISDVKMINYFLKCTGHSFSVHEIAWMLSYTKELRNQFEKKGELK